MAHLPHRCYPYGGYARHTKNTVIHTAIQKYNGDINPIKLLLEQNANDINARDSDGKTPLHFALKQERCTAELIIVLLQHGADAKATSTYDGNNALHWLAICCSADVPERLNIAWILLRHGCDINARNSEGCSPLHLAATCRNYFSATLMNVFLTNNSDVDMKNFNGDTPLHLYLQNEAARITDIRDFLRRVRDVNVANSKGETPLHLAVRNMRLASVWVVKLLLDHGADAGLTDSVGHNAYLAYCRAMEYRNRIPDHMTKMLLLENGLQQYMLNSSLHIACLYRNYDAVRKLLWFGVDVNGKDSLGNSPLYYALIACDDGDNRATLRMLLDYGADLNKKITLPNGRVKSLLEFVMIPGDIENYRTSVEIVLQHLAKLFTLQKIQVERGLDVEVLNKYNSDFLKSFVNLNMVRGYNGWLSRCSKELKLMSETEIGESRVTFLDLLFADAKKTAMYAKNKVLIKAFREEADKFPMYRGMLVAKLARDLERRSLIEKAAVSLSNSLRFADPSDEFFENMLLYCSNRDLANVIAGLGEK